MQVAELLGRGIKARRRQLGITQAELARVCGVSPVTAWRWEAGRQMPSQRHIGAIAQALGIDPVDLLKEPT